jgi:ribosomal-protein-alanine N-acetyltransferase
MWTPPEILTERLVLRPIDLEDSFYIYEYAKDKEVSLYTLWEPHTSVMDSEEFIKEYVFKMYKDNTPEPLAICFKDEPKHIIGTVGCFWVSLSSHVMELAYALKKEHWNKGITTEASFAIMKYCFENFEVNRIQCRCKVENQASKKVMEKLGMQYEGIHRKEIYHRDQHWDMYYFSLLRDEFLKD